MVLKGSLPEWFAYKILYARCTVKHFRISVICLQHSGGSALPFSWNGQGSAIHFFIRTSLQTFWKLAYFACRLEESIILSSCQSDEHHIFFRPVRYLNNCNKIRAVLFAWRSLNGAKIIGLGVLARGKNVCGWHKLKLWQLAHWRPIDLLFRGQATGAWTPSSGVL